MENKKIILKDVTIETVTNSNQVEKLIQKANKNRSVAQTNCNAHSSRSHSIFIMELNGKNELTKEERYGGLTLVDLAGSERLYKSDAKDKRKEETININKSLSTLSTVIKAIANKDSHIPYRDSKLTEVLQNSLSNESKTLMFVNISCEEDDTLETKASLNFATQVNNCVIGVAKRNVKFNQ